MDAIDGFVEDQPVTQLVVYSCYNHDCESGYHDDSETWCGVSCPGPHQCECEFGSRRDSSLRSGWTTGHCRAGFLPAEHSGQWSTGRWYHVIHADAGIRLCDTGSQYQQWWIDRADRFHDSRRTVGTATIPASPGVGFIRVPLNNDSLTEFPEDFLVTLIDDENHPSPNPYFVPPDTDRLGGGLNRTTVVTIENNDSSGLAGAADPSHNQANVAFKSTVSHQSRGEQYRQ